jgi:UDP-glucuronate 4-epimerase
MKIFITGVAGFIGFHLTNLLAQSGHDILGVDNLNNYYDPNLKLARLSKLGISTDLNEPKVQSQKYKNISFSSSDVTDYNLMRSLMQDFNPDIVIQLAAQAGVRYSIENPEVYVESNVKGFFNIIELCRRLDVKRLIYASSSSVYGNQNEVPYQETDRTDEPVSLYAATKKSNELFAHTYAHLFGIKAIGLRFFTVYGPYGRPDMAYFSFVKDILNGNTIRVFNEGNLSRDFTFIDDIVQSIQRLVDDFDFISRERGHQIFNIGNSKPIQLKRFIEIIEHSLGKKAIFENVGMQSGDVFKTFADVSSLESCINYRPSTSLDDGIVKFVNWYKQYYGE